MDSREDLVRVSVGSVQDWQRLKANYKNAILARLEENILTNGLAAEREELIAHTNKFIDRTFLIAQPNLRINGQNYESLDQNEQNMEPFDEALDRRIWSLADTRLQWHKRIAETRRELPISIEGTVVDLLEEQRVADAEELTLSMADIGAEDEDEPPVEPYPQVTEGFQQALALGEELDQTIPSQEERAERIRSVALEIKALKP